MSLRPMLFASRVGAIIHAAATHDTSSVDAVVESLSPGTREKARREVISLLTGELAGKPEADEQIYLVAAIARTLGVQVDEALIADGQWTQSAWFEYFSAIWTLVDARGRELVELLARRPLFGCSFESNWPHYGYLSLSETSELLAKLEVVAEGKPDLASSDFIGRFHSELLGWLREVQRRQTDLWLFAC